MTKESVTITSDFWVGIVEDNSNDPLKLGHCRVRIIGLHSFDAVELPTEGLPWAMPTLSLNGSKSFSVPSVNDWVFGYFMDGNNRQVPVILGTIPGLINDRTYVKMSGQQKREHDEKVSQQPQSKPTVEPQPKVGQPTVPATARGQIQNTSINTTNELRAHACDISFYIKHDVANSKNTVRNLVVDIRNGIIEALKALGVSPGTSSLKSFLEDVKRTLNSINKFLRKIVDNINDLVKVIKEIRAVIEYIVSLPQNLAKYFSACLNQLYATLSKAAFSIISGGYDEAVADTPVSISSEVSGILNETQQILKNSTLIYAGSYQIASSIVSPSGQQLTDDQVKKIFEGAFDGFTSFKQSDFQPVIQ